MAPELIQNKSYDYRIDIWALGILLYELVHGFAPFKGKSFCEISQKIRKCNLIFSGSISNELKLLLQLILQQNPNQRITLTDIQSHHWMQTRGGQVAYEKESSRNEEQTI